MAILTGGALRTELYFGAAVAGRPMTSAAVFDSASLTKPLFAWYVLELAASGELDLYAPIAIDYATLGAAEDPRLGRITPAMVLSHQTGLPNWRPDGEPLRLVATPGEQVVYSGEGFQLLLKTLQNERGADTVAAELQDLLDRFGMTGSSFVDPPAGAGSSFVDPPAGAGSSFVDPPAGAAGSDGGSTGYAVAHDADGRPLARRARERIGAYGTLDVTLPDYAKFLESAFWGWDSVSARRIRALTTGPYGVPQGGRTLGWGCWSRADGTIVLHQNGDNPGYKHLALVDPAAGEAVVALTNGEGGLAFTDQLAARFRRTD
ncbi:CubicO group peptidase (beta-lactamase class C family) [Kribbella voronezhensis]|uniref:CubicO group peptidase (Beta-lactamase class C family) n=1 Tax=Kribbella voronezhensis TaxID=2512212 RepID=A0A4R7SZU4_9ACTN|nr:CubicO group peptidase (beta-lactamase class C family) [Kribbella voronezhensis]